MTLLHPFDSLFDEQLDSLLGLARDRLATGGGGAPRAFVPAADLLVTEDEVTVVMDLPGMHPENLEIELSDDVLTVRGERSYPFATGAADGKTRSWHRLERGYGRFQRMLQVPKGLDPDRVTASMTDGVLTIHIPQPEARKPRRIEIASDQALIGHESEEPALAGTV